MDVKEFILLKSNNGSSVYIRWSGNEDEMTFLQEFMQKNCQKVKPINIEEKFLESFVDGDINQKTFKIDVLFKWNDLYENYIEIKKGEYLCEVLYAGDIAKYMFNK